jgi:hypothetical protein
MFVFALAYAAIAHLAGLIYEIREQNNTWIERGLSACDRAMALAPDLAEVMVARARLFLCAEEIRGSRPDRVARLEQTRLRRLREYSRPRPDVQQPVQRGCGALLRSPEE